MNRTRGANYIVHTPDEINRIRIAAQLTALVRDKLAELIHPGMTTLQIDQLAGELIAEVKGRSAFLNYHGYPGNICVSVNDEIVHGIGRPDRLVRPEDIVSIDIGVEFNGGIGDTALTVGFAAPTPEVKKLLDSTRAALAAGIAAAVPGNYIRDISRAIEKVARSAGLGIVEELVGHGCGMALHEPPEVPNYVTPFRGPRLVPGMVLAIEPMLNLGTHKVKTDADGWTVRTRDGAMSAHFEHTVLITHNQPEILTWPKTM